MNEATIKDRFLIPTIDDMFDELRGSMLFSIIDLRVEYHQIRVEEEGIYKIAFRTHNGHFKYLVMPFGLCNALSKFKACRNETFKLYLR